MKSLFLVVKSIFLVVKSLFLVVKSIFLAVKSLFSVVKSLFVPGFPGEISMRCSWGIHPIGSPGSLPGNRHVARRLSGRHRVLQSRLQEPKGKLRTVRLFLGSSIWMMRIGHTIYIYICLYMHHHIWLNVVEYCISYIYIYISQIYCVNMFNCKPPECKFRT